MAQLLRTSKVDWRRSAKHVAGLCRKVGIFNPLSPLRRQTPLTADTSELAHLLALDQLLEREVGK